MSSSELSLLWEKYKDHDDLEARDKLIIHYAPMVKYVANRLAINLSSVVETDELISYGIEGLIDAIERYDHTRNIKFETYAVTRIRGSMIDGLRSMDWVPVSIRQKSKELEKVYTKLEAKLGRSATDEEVAKEMGISVDDLHQLLKDVASTTIISLDDFITGDEEDNKKRIIDMLEDNNSTGTVELVEFREIKDILAKSITKLPEKEKTVIYLYYYEGLTLKEIGAVLTLSESRISQLHTKAILRLRGSLSKKKQLLF
ncbi:RNA polymerase sigma factor for flagellar operon [Candidatus Syntrophocurvum alkaliphilum]|uniref:RNA polymerase sigma factor for flagellar operon n=1 Tax=Candidatus Syntrophocurvum alkaliphilum TaxID=2293317 RepID=A0A6I6DEV0_9FIRM|nr:RNA polymerase sigma factor WhiG [Candidatus Syntrophocurvum alkaliphilum]QGT99192.1 RNA polymerase sigma factor for flagellar operon [Candidatus Syntrophocurvum alkaliphilum]